MLEDAAEDALQQQPDGTFDEIVDLACRMNVWRTIETLHKHSQIVCAAAAEGSLRVVGAYFDAQTGRVLIMGEHPSACEFTALNPSGDVVRTAGDQPVPAEEAHAMLVSGNNRYANGKGGLTVVQGDDRLLKQARGKGGCLWGRAVDPRRPASNPPPHCHS